MAGSSGWLLLQSPECRAHRTGAGVEPHFSAGGASYFQQRLPTVLQNVESLEECAARRCHWKWQNGK